MKLQAVDGDKSEWNQRIIRTREGEETWTQEPVLPRGETKAELMNDIAHFVSALRHPVLTRSVEDGRPPTGFCGLFMVWVGASRTPPHRGGYSSAILPPETRTAKS